MVLSSVLLEVVVGNTAGGGLRLGGSNACCLLTGTDSNEAALMDDSTEISSSPSAVRLDKELALEMGKIPSRPGGSGFLLLLTLVPVLTCGLSPDNNSAFILVAFS